MTRKAAEVADGLLVMPFDSARHFTERTLPALTDGLRRSGRTADDFPVIAQVMVALGRTEEALSAAIGGVGALIAFYGSTPAYRPVPEVEGWAQVHSRLNALKAGGFAEMRALVTDEMVRMIGVVGTPEECATQIATRFGVGIEEVCCYFPGYPPDMADVADLVDALHERRDATAPTGVRGGKVRPRR